MRANQKNLPEAVIKLLQKAGRDRIARRVVMLGIHDDNLIAVQILPPRTRKNTATIRFELEDDGSGKQKTLTFLGCANLRFAMDFDVMAANWFAQTKAASCTNGAIKMRKFARSQKRLWHTRYMPPYHPEAPIRRKLSEIRKYHLFKVKFFGGVAEILAKNFQLEMR